MHTSLPHSQSASYVISGARNVINNHGVFYMIAPGFTNSVARLGGLPPNWASFDRLGPGEGVKSLRGRGSCHSTCHRQVRLPVAAATAMCACHTHQPPVCAPATRTSHQYVRLPHAPATAKRDQPHDQPQLNQSRRHGRAMGGPGPPCESL